MPFQVTTLKDELRHVGKPHGERAGIHAIQ